MAAQNRKLILAGFISCQAPLNLGGLRRNGDPNDGFPPPWLNTHSARRCGFCGHSSVAEQAFRRQLPVRNRPKVSHKSEHERTPPFGERPGRAGCPTLGPHDGEAIGGCRPNQAVSRPPYQRRLLPIPTVTLTPSCPATQTSFISGSPGLGQVRRPFLTEDDHLCDLLTDRVCEI